MNREIIKELDDLLQLTGDNITNVFEQLIKGNWVDDHGHEVKMNKHMLELQPTLVKIMKFRSDWLGYNETSVR